MVSEITEIHFNFTSGRHVEAGLLGPPDAGGSCFWHLITTCPSHSEVDYSLGVAILGILKANPPEHPPA